MAVSHRKFCSITSVSHYKFCSIQTVSCRKFCSNLVVSHCKFCSVPAVSSPNFCDFLAVSCRKFALQNIPVSKFCYKKIKFIHSFVPIFFFQFCHKTQHYTLQPRGCVEKLSPREVPKILTQLPRELCKGFQEIFRKETQGHRLRVYLRKVSKEPSHNSAGCARIQGASPELVQA